MNINLHKTSLKCKRKLPFTTIEEALVLWVENTLQVGLIITDDILSTKVLEFAFLYNKERFKGSDRWIDNFKKQYNLKYREAASVLLQNLNAMHENLCQILKDYDPKDIFNYNETGLFWKIQLNRIISNGPIIETK
ncbi:tigger transposable element-derived protein 6-like [Rhizophagus irregularis DAOM 181602=DAOM 197198]|uniref:HTH CENPB-type domain-containing protein n=2 Tax=Rhizophagus irregularis TaxID=588596 RepID=A0A015MZY0_RHIIW|nr:hypothetical protein RirG_070010 [Rhizophagus irregularis DAOM 197198w]GBC50341.1 tigger transposable element-derived protein 6-like [Rhizophagus irregularis DAOM 181602=DAOM 197198]